MNKEVSSYANREVLNFAAEFRGAGYLMPSDSEGEENFPVYIIRSIADRDDYVAGLMLTASAWTNDPQIIAAGKREIIELFDKYDEEFLARKTLVIALIDRGSGSLRFGVNTISNDCGSLNVVINRFKPMIMTMDYRQWVMFLLVDNQECIKSVQITLHDKRV